MYMEDWHDFFVDFLDEFHENATMQLRLGIQDQRFWRLQGKNMIEDETDCIFTMLSMIQLASHGHIWASNTTTN